MSEPARVALVTGSSSGIGEATVKLLATKGYRIVVQGSREEKVKRVAKECIELSPEKYEPLELVLDFNNPDNAEVAVTKTIQHFGRLDVLVNNAGIFTRTSPDDEGSYDVYRQVMSINTDSTVRATLAACSEIKKNKGSIIMVSSVASFKPSDKGFAYCMSKAAMTMFAKNLSIELAPDVRVNIVSPGPVVTPIFERVGIKTEYVQAIMKTTTLCNRAGEPDEVAKVIAFLVSDDASFVNGHEMVVDGGYVIKASNFSASSQIVDALGKAKTDS